MTRKIAFKKNNEPDAPQRYITKYKNLFFLAFLLIAGGSTFIYYHFNKKHARERREMVEALAEIQYLIDKKRYNEALEGKPGIYSGLEVLSKRPIRDKDLHNLVHLYLAFICKEKKQYEQALVYLGNMHQYTTGFMQARIKCLKGDIYCEMAQYDQALAAYLAASECNPDKFFTPGYLIKAAGVYEKQKDYKQAIACYQTIVDDYPTCYQYTYAEKQLARLTCLNSKLYPAN